MSQPDVLELAKQGNPRAIAAIVNHLGKPHHISAKATRQDDRLHILLESEQPIHQPTAVALIYKIVSSLKSDAIETIHIYGRQTGEKSVVWNQEITLAASIMTPPPELEQPEATDPAESEAMMQADAAMAESSMMAQNEQFSLSLEPEQVELPATLPPATTTPPESTASNTVAEPEIDQSETLAFLQKPESFILITFALVLLLWEAYISFMEEAAAEESTAGKGFAPKSTGDDRRSTT
jgi:hypothetical protein